VAERFVGDAEISTVVREVSAYAALSSRKLWSAAASCRSVSPAVCERNWGIATVIIMPMILNAARVSMSENPDREDALEARCA
jgi:hypothetical protein